MSDPLHRWLMFLDRETDLRTLEEVFKMDRGIRRAQERMDLVTQDREAYRAYELREAQIAFYDEDVREAAREAAQEATAKAQEAAKIEKLEIARNLKAMGIPIEQISRVTNLSSEEAQKL